MRDERKRLIFNGRMGEGFVEEIAIGSSEEGYCR